MDEQSIFNTQSGTVIAATAFDDVANNVASNVEIDGKEGNDFMTTYPGTTRVTLTGGAGNDTIYSFNSTKNSLNGGEGDDYIYNGNDSKTNTLVGGKGNDTILNLGQDALITYKDGEGNDVVEGFNASSTLKIGNGTTATYNSKVSGKDVIISVGDGKITLTGAASWMKFDADNNSANIAGTYQDITLRTVTDSDSSIPAIASEVIKVDATKRTKAITIVGNNLDNVILGGSGKNTIYGAEGNDSILGGKNNDFLFGDEGDDTLSGGEGNDQLTGGEGEDTFVYSLGKDTIMDYTVGKDIIALGSASFADIARGYASKENAIISLGGGNYISIVGGKYQELTLVDSTGEELTTIIGGEVYTDAHGWQQTLKADTEFANAINRTKVIQITGNDINNTIYGGEAKNTIRGGGGDDYLRGGKNNDILFGDEGDDTLSGGEGNDQLTGGEGEDTFVYSLGKDTIMDYTVGKDIIALGSASFADIVRGYTAKEDAVISLGGGNYISIVGGKYQELTLVDSTGEELTTIVGGEAYTDAHGWQQTLKATTEFANAINRTKVIQITGNDINNTIYGGEAKNTIHGGGGDDYIRGGAQADVLYGDSGVDTFAYTGGDDVIMDYADGEVISINSAFADGFDTVESGKSDLVFTVGKGHITLKGARNANWLVVDSNGDTTGPVGRVVLTNNDSWQYVAGEKDKIIDATARSKVTKITGNELNNTILGGKAKDIVNGDEGHDYIEGNAGDDSLFGAVGDDTLIGSEGADTLIGGDGADSLWGGAGNDILTGGAGVDTFIYNPDEGDDTITDVTKNDLISVAGELQNITAIVNAATFENNSVILNVGSNTLTLSNLKLEDKVNINGVKCRVSETGLRQHRSYETW